MVLAGRLGIRMGLEATITRLAWRRAAAAAGREIARCLLIATAAAIVLVAADKLVYLGVDVRWMIGALLCTAVVAGLAIALYRGRIDRLGAAIEADRVLDLGDRMASALQLGRTDGPWAKAVAKDADERSRAVRSAEVFPLRLPLPARFLVPAVIVLALVWLLPPLDLLGRMQRAVETQVRERLAAERTAGAADGAMAESMLGSSGGVASEAGGPGRLRVVIFKIEQELAGGKMDNVRRITLSKELQRLAERLNERGAAPKLTEAIRKASERLAANDANALASLRAAREELDRIEKALKDPEFADAYARRIAERTRAELRAAAPDTGQTGAPVAGDGGGEDLVELAASAKRPPDSAGGSSGILYSPSDAGTSRPADSRGHAAALKAADAQIESGAIPPRHARLVRSYFDSVRPVRE